MKRETLLYGAFINALAFFGERTICVFREYQGKPAILRIENQKHFKEWTGCFSLYNYAEPRK